MLDPSSEDNDVPVDPQSAMRSHLSRERTFLSWIRTSLSFMAFGIALEKFSVFLHYAAHEVGVRPVEPGLIETKVLAVALTVMGGLIALVGAFRVERWARCTVPVKNQPTQHVLATIAGITLIICAMLTMHILGTRF